MLVGTSATFTINTYTFFYISHIVTSMVARKFNIDGGYRYRNYRFSFPSLTSNTANVVKEQC